MHPLLVGAAAQLQIELPALEAAAATTAEARAAAESAIEDSLRGGERSKDEPLIVAFGSMARDEMGVGSDFDYLVVLNRVESDPGTIVRYRRAALEALRAIGVRQPGSSGLFGVAVSGADLVNTIGLETDTNLHLSRRILLLEESVPLNASGAWTHLVEAVIARYLHEHRSPGPKVPRFLLNDAGRYWRTIAVDYQAKRWQEVTSEKWGLRYVKLITTRKLTFAGMVSSLFLPVLSNEEATAELLRGQCELPALARLAQLERYLSGDARQALADVLISADRIVGHLATREFRAEVEPITEPHDRGNQSSALRRAVEISETIQAGLERIFFGAFDGAEETARLGRRYLAF